MKLRHSFETPIGYAIAGSFVLHIILVSMYGNLLTSGELPSPPPPPKKFKIEMMAKKPKPVKKAPVIEKKIVKPKMASPIKIKKPHTSYSAQKINKKEIALQPVSPMIPIKPKMVQEARIPSARIHRSMKGNAKPADISPLPRPVENARIFSKVSGKETRFYASAAGFVPSAPKPKSVSATHLASSGGRAKTRIHHGPKVIAHGLPQARTVAVDKSQGANQTKAVEFKGAHTSRPMAPTLAAMHPSTSELESVTTPGKTAQFYEARIRTVSTVPLARVSSVTPSSSRRSGNKRRTGFVQKGEMVAAATFPSPRPVPDIDDPRVLDGYLGALQKLIASAKKYPESARKSGREGKVTVQFTVMKNGAVKNIQLVSKANYRDLDKEAIAAVKRAAPFSGFPEGIGKPFLDIVLPFRFKLNE